VKSPSKPLALILVPIAILAIVYSLKAPPDEGAAAQAGLPIAVDTSALNSGTPSEPHSFLFFLFDASASFHTTDPARSQLVASIALMEQTLRAWWDHSYLPPPTRIFVSTLGSTSSEQLPLCEFSLDPGGPFALKDSSALRRDLSECRGRLERIQPQNYTDIPSSLKAAEIDLHGRNRAPRGIVIISDFASDPPPDRGPAVPNLKDVCVAMILGSGTDTGTGRDPHALDRRIETWKANLEQWGAIDSEYWRRGFTPAELGSFLQECRT
jgi:hypothetical protein